MQSNDLLHVEDWLLRYLAYSADVRQTLLPAHNTTLAGGRR